MRIHEPLLPMALPQQHTDGSDDRQAEKNQANASHGFALPRDLR
jgi:hypothetical protein